MTTSAAPGVVPQVGFLLRTIFNLLGLSYDFSAQTSPGFKLEINSPDGRTMGVTLRPSSGPTVQGTVDGMGVGFPVATGTLVAGHLDTIALPNVAGDRLSVAQITAGGTAADHFSVVRVDANTVKVQAHDAAGALVATNTSLVAVYNFGQ